VESDSLKAGGLIVVDDCNSFAGMLKPTVDGDWWSNALSISISKPVGGD